MRDIHQLTQEGDLKHLKQELDHKRLATVTDAAGMTPLHKAVLWEQPQVVHYLLENFQLDVNAKDHVRAYNVSSRKFILKIPVKLMFNLSSRANFCHICKPFLCVQMDRTPLHYAAALDDSGNMYNVLMAEHGDENIPDLVRLLPLSELQLYIITKGAGVLLVNIFLDLSRFQMIMFGIFHRIVNNSNKRVLVCF